jgi:hypothetical protein
MSIKKSLILSFAYPIVGILLLLFSSFMLYFNLGKNGNLIILIIKDFLFSVGLMLYTAPLLVNKHYYLGGWFKDQLFVIIYRVVTPMTLSAPIIIKAIIYSQRVLYYFNFINNLVWFLSFAVLVTFFGYLLCAFFEKPVANIIENLYGNDLKAKNEKGKGKDN